MERELGVVVDTPPRINYSKCPEYRDFRAALWRVRHADEDIPPSVSDQEEGDGEEEMVMVSQVRQSLRCPISQMTMVEPVKNPACGHSYSSAAIHQLLQVRGGGSTISCPLHGCNKQVRASALIRDEALEARLKQAAEPRIFL